MTFRSPGKPKRLNKILRRKHYSSLLRLLILFKYGLGFTRFALQSVFDSFNVPRARKT